MPKFRNIKGKKRTSRQ